MGGVLVPCHKGLSTRFLLSFDELLFEDLGPQQVVLFLMDFRFSDLHGNLSQLTQLLYHMA